MLDNSEIVAKFCPAVDDGDGFIYTEMLDRSQKKGNNGQRLLKTFYHRSVGEFWEQLPTIKRLCDMSLVRACTRLGMRSFKKVGQTHTRLVVEAALSENWIAHKSLYNRACGTTSPDQKVWIWDIDIVNEKTECFRDFLTKINFKKGQLVPPGEGDAIFLGELPSKKGKHYLTRPFDTSIASEYMRVILGIEGGLKPNGDMISLHKDNPTNLYIPDGAD